MVYAGIFLVTLATLLLEINLTRILSVTMWYHYAFFVISIAMFGLTAGATIVYQFPNMFKPQNALRQMAIFALLFGISTVGSMYIYLQISAGAIDPLAQETVGSLAVTYIVVSIPFVFSGIVVALALTQIPKPIGFLYAADLGGAAVACVVFTHVLDYIDAISALILIAAATCGGAALFARGCGRRRITVTAHIACAIFLALTLANTYLARQGAAWFQIRSAKGVAEGPNLYERWNSFSRITVTGDPNVLERPYGLSWSEAMPADFKVEQLLMLIDAASATPLYRYSGNPADMRFLGFDVTNVVHRIRTNGDQAIVGVGGGRDVMAALAFGQQSILGIELNPNVLHATTKTFGELTGHFDQNPKVRLIVDEARSHLARSQEQFDIIQISLIDTFAATAAGAFSLSENSLYTTDAWNVFLDRLKPNGVLSVSRMYIPTRPTEMYRLTALADGVLRGRGITNTIEHVAVIASTYEGASSPQLFNIATLLLSPSPFSHDDVAKLQRVCEEMGFQILLAPKVDSASDFKAMVTPLEAKALADRLCTDLSPPSDDRPYFFNMLRVRDILNPGQWSRIDFNAVEMVAPRTLGVLILIVTVLLVAAVFLPLAVRKPAELFHAGNVASLIYFAGIGTGYMFVEIALLQRLIIFLGHPTYALSTVLFTLLLASGAGSFVTARVLITQERARLPVLALIVLILVGALILVLMPWTANTFAASQTPVRIAVAVLLAAPLGFLMGVPFPLGMTKAKPLGSDLLPWLWGINGAASVWSSVLATGVCLWFGISQAFICGLISYVISAVSYLYIKKRGAPLQAAIECAAK